MKKSFQINAVRWLLLFSVFLIMTMSTNSFAKFFAYIPDLSNNENGQLLHVVNTDDGILVDSVLIFGSPRDVFVNHAGSNVYVSSVVTSGNRTASYINIIITQNNTTRPPILVRGEYVRGLVVTKDDNVVYVTHANGVTKISNPIINPFSDLIELTYTGISLVLSSDEKYLFVIGIDNNNNDGISVIETSTMTEVSTYLIGKNTLASSIVFDDNNNRLFVANRRSDSLISLQINNYDDAASLEITEIESLDFSDGSNPIDLLLNSDGTQLFVVLSKIIDGAGSGNGKIQLLNANNIQADAIYTTSQNDISKEGGVFSPEDGSGSIHPLAIARDNSGNIHFIKQLWNELPGTYSSVLEEFSSNRNGTRSFIETGSVRLGPRASTQANGRFIGPDCSYCPDGLEGLPEPVIYPSSINPFMLLLSLILLVRVRRFY